VPRILSAIAFLDCEPVAEHLAGDHWIVVARVHDLFADHGRDALIFIDGTLGSFVALRLSLSQGKEAPDNTPALPNTTPETRHHEHPGRNDT